MIPRPNVVEWARRAGWPTDEQNEQDLLLSRLIVEIARDRYLGEELVFRGGTCLHKLHADKVYRYSEDLDYVRRTGGGIAEVTRSLTAIGERLGMEVRTQIAAQPKVHLRAPFESGTGRMQIKIEVNTFDRCRDPQEREVHGIEGAPAPIAEDPRPTTTARPGASTRHMWTGRIRDRAGRSAKERSSSRTSGVVLSRSAGWRRSQGGGLTARAPRRYLEAPE